MKKKCEDKNVYIAVPATLGGIFLAITLFFLIFAKEQLVFLISIAWAFVVLGFVALLFACLSARKKKR